MTVDRSERKLATVLFADLAGSTALADEQDPERTRARLVREFDRLEELLGDDEWMKRQIWFSLPAAAAHLDSLVVVRPAAELEAAAQRLGQRGSYLEPFGVRALGVAREDEALLAQADAAFRAMGLDWHADQTEQLRALRQQALG